MEMASSLGGRFMLLVVLVLRVFHPFDLESEFDQRVEIAMVDCGFASQTLEVVAKVACRVDALPSVDSTLE